MITDETRHEVAEAMGWIKTKGAGRFNIPWITKGKLGIDWKVADVCLLYACEHISREMKECRELGWLDLRIRMAQMPDKVAYRLTDIALDQLFETRIVIQEQDRNGFVVYVWNAE